MPAAYAQWSWRLPIPLEPTPARRVTCSAGLHRAAQTKWRRWCTLQRHATHHNRLTGAGGVGHVDWRVLLERRQCQRQLEAKSVSRALHTIGGGFGQHHRVAGLLQAMHNRSVEERAAGTAAAAAHRRASFSSKETSAYKRDLQHRPIQTPNSTRTVNFCTESETKSWLALAATRRHKSLMCAIKCGNESAIGVRCEEGALQKKIEFFKHS